ncbi:Response regulator transcription factor [Flavobacterium longum]|uniref:LytR/AlgR family response regulator transcription factor n=1 Tax=Flavobacterium longum TaxID=1299340 RepID=UPI0039E99821
MAQLPYIIIDDNQESIRETRALAERFPTLLFCGSATNYDDGLNMILEFKPAIVFLEIDPVDPESGLSLSLINELYRYLKAVPKIIVTTQDRSLAFDALKHEVADYLVKPLEINEFRKSVLRLERADVGLDLKEIHVPVKIDAPEMLNGSLQTPENATEVSAPVMIDEIAVAPSEDQQETPQALPEDIETTAPIARPEKPLTICVKSYGDYRFIAADDICYLQADNNSTDIHLNNGEMVTAFKTLKHFETVLPSPFVRIHNSYIVNIDYVSRIHTGNAVCYIKNTTTKLPFSKSYKENVDAILTSITKGNYLEI